MRNVSHFSFLSGAYPPKDNGIYSLKGQGNPVYYGPQDALKEIFGGLGVAREAEHSV